MLNFNFGFRGSFVELRIWLQSLVRMSGLASVPKEFRGARDRALLHVLCTDRGVTFAHHTACGMWHVGNRCNRGVSTNPTPELAHAMLVEAFALPVPRDPNQNLHPILALLL